MCVHDMVWPSRVLAGCNQGGEGRVAVYLKVLIQYMNGTI